MHRDRSVIRYGLAWWPNTLTVELLLAPVLPRESQIFRSALKRSSPPSSYSKYAFLWKESQNQHSIKWSFSKWCQYRNEPRDRYWHWEAISKQGTRQHYGNRKQRRSPKGKESRHLRFKLWSITFRGIRNTKATQIQIFEPFDPITKTITNRRIQAVSGSDD